MSLPMCHVLCNKNYYIIILQVNTADEMSLIQNRKIQRSLLVLVLVQALATKNWDYLVTMKIGQKLLLF